MADDFPNDVRQFIQRNIESLAQMELLFLLRSEREKKFEAAEVGKRLSFERAMAAQLLIDLATRGFAIREGESFQYRSADAETDAVVEKLAETYRARRLAVTNEIYSKPISRLQSFADAFRFRKGE